jgi:hypothetical protein
MPYSKLKIFLCLSVCFLFLFGPILLEITPVEKAYAGGGGQGSKKKKSHYSSASEAGPEKFGYKIGDPENSTAPAPVPEPATWLLVGAGAAGLAAYKKKFKKK